MLHYWKKNRLLISTISYILMVSLVSMVFIGSAVEYVAKSIDTASLYKSNDINFDVPSPAKDQINELELNAHIETVIPYYYTTKSVYYEESKVESNVGILFFENFNNIESTMYNSNRLLEKNPRFSDNPLIIDYKFMKETNLKLGDRVKIDFYGVQVDFTIDAVFETNTYYHNNVILGIWNGIQKTITEENIEKDLNFSGAYIISNDVEQSNLYFRNEYKPYGKLKEREEFATDEAYNIHYDAFINANYSNEITNFETNSVIALEKAENYYQSAYINILSGSLLLILLSAIFNFLMLNRKSEIKYFKTKKRLGAKYKSYYIYSTLYETILVGLTFFIFTSIFWKISTYYIPIVNMARIWIFLFFIAIISSLISLFGINFLLKKAS